MAGDRMRKQHHHDDPSAQHDNQPDCWGATATASATTPTATCSQTALAIYTGRYSNSQAAATNSTWPDIVFSNYTVSDLFFREVK